MDNIPIHTCSSYFITSTGPLLRLGRDFEVVDERLQLGIKCFEMKVGGYHSVFDL